MGLRERLADADREAAKEAAREPRDTNAAAVAYDEVKSQLHRSLIDRLELKVIETLPREELREELRGILAGLMGAVTLPMNRSERETLVEELLDEVTGFGPLEPLLRDPTISDILVNGASSLYVERQGKLEPCPVRFRDNDHLLQIINRMVSRVGRRVDETVPMVDARLPDGSRVNAIIPPLAIHGPVLSIRRFGSRPLRVADLIRVDAMTVPMLELLASSVRARANLLISGGTGTGKTTLLNALSAFIPETERVITVEDAAELQLQQRHVVSLETRPANIEGKGAIIARDLVRNSLRMRPDRIIVGEVRGGEVLDMLHAMNTGHEGSMTTVHANSPRDALTRLEGMIGESGVPMPEAHVRQTIARGFQMIVQLTRGSDGRRRVTSIAEITGTEGPTIVLSEVYCFRQTGVDPSGKVLGEFVATGLRPKLSERIQVRGIDPEELVRPFLEA